jgi:hypothetical protein
MGVPTATLLGRFSHCAIRQSPEQRRIYRTCGRDLAGFHSIALSGANDAGWVVLANLHVRPGVGARTRSDLIAGFDRGAAQSMRIGGQ